MTEHKILFHSSSYSRLTEGCRALTALMYPFKYTHVNIPLLPAALIDFLDTPTPFIMGVHSSLKHEVAELVSILKIILFRQNSFAQFNIIKEAKKKKNFYSKTCFYCVLVIFHP